MPLPRRKSDMDLTLNTCMTSHSQDRADCMGDMVTSSVVPRNGSLAAVDQGDMVYQHDVPVAPGGATITGLTPT